MNNSVIGITGASGFIGTQLTKALLKEYTYIKTLVHTNTQSIEDVQGCKGNLSTGEGLDAFLENVSILIHLSARQLPPESDMFVDNSIATKNLLDACPSTVEYIIYISSVVVYGDNEKKILSEEDACFPSTEYGVSKYIGEILTQYWGRKKKKKIVILRPFNIYGKESKKGVIYSLYNSIKQNNSINIFGDGHQKRDFLYIDDVIAAIKQTIALRPNGIINLGNGTEYSLLEVVNIFEEILKKKIPIKYKPADIEKPQRIQYLTEKANKLLHWNASIDLKEGLRRIIDSHQ